MRCLAASAQAPAGLRRRERLPGIRPAGDPRRPRGAEGARRQRASSACRACCSPPATSRTTCPRRSTRSPPRTRRSRSPSAASWRSSRSCCARPPRASPRPRPPASGSCSRRETLLMVVGRGTNDPDANANVAKVARMLWEGMGFGWTEVCYSGVAYPLVDEGLQHAVRLGYRRIIVFPYFLFTGILVERIYQHADDCQAAHPGDRDRQGRLSQRPSAGHRHLRRAAERSAERRQPDELPAVQVPGADPGLRGRPGRAAGRPPLSTCAASAPTAITAMTSSRARHGRTRHDHQA